MLHIRRRRGNHRQCNSNQYIRPLEWSREYQIACVKVGLLKETGEVLVKRAFSRINAEALRRNC